MVETGAGRACKCDALRRGGQVNRVDNDQWTTRGAQPAGCLGKGIGHVRFFPEGGADWQIADKGACSDLSILQVDGLLSRFATFPRQKHETLLKTTHAARVSGVG